LVRLPDSLRFGSWLTGLRYAEVRMSVRCLSLVLCAALLLAACGSGETKATDSAPPVEGQSESVPSPELAVESDPGPGSVLVSDARGESEVGDLLKVALAFDGSEFTTTFQLAAPVPTAGTALLSVMVSSKSADQFRQLGVHFIDGRSYVWVFDIGTAKEDNFDVTPRVVGNTVSARFPAAAVAGLGASFNWHATYTVNGDDVDEVPPGEGKAVFPG
jgi:hypothetical protein